MFGLLAAVALAGIIVIKIRNKDGTETEIKVPEGSTVEVTKDGKTLGVFPKKDDPTAKKEPPVGVVAGSPWTRVPVGQSPLDKLDPKEIPAEERFDYQPKELVAVIGTHARRMWWTVSAVAVSPDGKLAAISKRSGEVMLWDVATQKPKWPAPMTLGGNMLDFTPDSGRLIVGTSAATAGISVIDVTAAVPSLEQWRTGEKPGAVIEVKGTVVWVLEGGRTLLVRADDLKEQQSRFTLVDISGATSRHTEGELLNHLFGISSPQRPTKLSMWQWTANFAARRSRTRRSNRTRSCRSKSMRRNARGPSAPTASGWLCGAATTCNCGTWGRSQQNYSPL